MREDEFVIAFSQKAQEAAIKEVSLTIKSRFPKEIKYLILLFTPNYAPPSILNTLKITLRPKQVLGIQAPFLIFEDRVIQKGIVACCINKSEMGVREFFSRSDNVQKIAMNFNESFKKLKKPGINFLSFLSPKINPLSYLAGLRQSLGKVFNLLGLGFMRKYSWYDSQIINDNIDEGLLNVAVGGINIEVLKLGGYLPLAKPFTITKSAPTRGVIMEIDDRPAVDIYKKYLEEDFQTFLKNHLFSFYPLGIKEEGGFKIINIIDFLEDGSLICTGQVKENSRGHIMFLDPTLALQKLENNLQFIESPESRLAFVVNSTVRKKLLKDTSFEEVQAIKHFLGEKTKVIGLYSDFSFSSDKNTGDIDIEAGNILLSLWQ